MIYFGLGSRNLVKVIVTIILWMNAVVQIYVKLYSCGHCWLKRQILEVILSSSKAKFIFSIIQTDDVHLLKKFQKLMEMPPLFS